MAKLTDAEVQVAEGVRWTIMADGDAAVLTLVSFTNRFTREYDDAEKEAFLRIAGFTSDHLSEVIGTQGGDNRLAVNLILDAVGGSWL